MADTKTSLLSSASTIDGSELVAVVQGGANKKATIAALISSINAPGISIPVGSLDNWKAARALHASQLVETVEFGDSSTSCEYVTGGWVRKLRDIALAANYTDGGRGVVGEGDNSGASGEALPIVQARTGFAVGGGTYDFMLTGTFVSSASADTVTFQGYGTQCRIHYGLFTTTGRWSWSVDGGAATTVTDTIGTTLVEHKSIVIPLGAAGLHTVTIVNLGGNPISPPVIAASGNHGSGSLPAGTYDYQITIENAAGETLPSATNTFVLGATGGIDFLFNTNPIQIQVGQTYRVFRRQGADPFSLLSTVTIAGGTYTSFSDLGAFTPDTNVHPPVTNTAGLDSTNNKVRLTPEFLQDEGLVWHKQAVSGIGIASFFGLPVADPTNNSWAAATALGLSSGSPPAYADSSVDWSNAEASHPTYRHPALAILCLGINNQQGSADSDAAWDAARAVADGVGQFVHLCRAAGVDPLVVVPHCDYASNRKWSQRFREAVWSTATSMGAATVDFNEALGPYNDGVALYGTGPHLNQAGYDQEAQWLWDNVLSA